MTQPTDATLLAHSRQGRGGFEAFYARHRELVLAFLARRTGDPEVAADLMAETFAAALLAVHDHARDLPDEPVAWLFGIARHKLLDSYRRRRVEDAARRRLALEPLALDDDDLRRVDDIASATDIVAQLSLTLPPDQVEAIRARVLDERQYADIAQDLRCSEAVVRMRVSRGLRTLRTTLEDPS